MIFPSQGSWAEWAETGVGTHVPYGQTRLASVHGPARRSTVPAGEGEAKMATVEISFTETTSYTVSVDLGKVAEGAAIDPQALRNAIQNVDSEDMVDWDAVARDHRSAWEESGDGYITIDDVTEAGPWFWRIHQYSEGRTND